MDHLYTETMGDCVKWHWYQEFIHFAKKIDVEIPPRSELYLIERWFREMTDKHIRRRSSYNIPDLTRPIKVSLGG